MGLLENLAFSMGLIHCAQCGAVIRSQEEAGPVHTIVGTDGKEKNVYYCKSCETAAEAKERPEERPAPQQPQETPETATPAEKPETPPVILEKEAAGTPPEAAPVFQEPVFQEPVHQEGEKKSMLSTVQSFIQEMEKNNLKYRDPQELPDGNVAVGCGVNGASTRYDIVYFFDKAGHAVSFRIFQLLKVPVDKQYQVLELCNELNALYRWFKFFIDKENNVNYQTDAIIDSNTSGRICVELLIRTMKIIDECYPKFMKAIWAED